MLRKITLMLIAMVSSNTAAWAVMPNGYVANITALRTLPPGVTYSSVVVGGYYATGDKGGGTFVQTVSPSCTPASDNGGTVIYNASNGICYGRASSNYGPKEFGAKGGGVGNDWQAIKNWLAVDQPHIGDADTYILSQTLICNNVTIQGPSNLNGASGTPLFVLRANTVFASNSELIDAQDHCRLSGVGLDGNSVTIPLAVDPVNGARVAIDGASALQNGNPYNLYCNKTGEETTEDGLMVKDSILVNSTSDNLVIQCPNVRLIGNVIYGSGGNGVTATGDDLTIADGSDWGNGGNAVYLDGAFQVSIVGMDFNNNGQTLADAGHGYGAAIFLDGASLQPNKTVSICGNHFRGSAASNTSTAHGGHIYFDGLSKDLSFCGNTYSLDKNGVYPNYVYDSSGSAATLNPAGFYEDPPTQAVNSNTYSPSAQGTVLQWLVLPSGARFARRLGIPRQATPNEKSSGATGSW